MKPFLSFLTFLIYSGLSFAIPPEPTPDENHPSLTEIWDIDGYDLEEPSEPTINQSENIFDIDLYLTAAEEDQADEKIRWEARLPNGKKLVSVRSRDRSKIGFRIPASATRPSQHSDNLWYADVTITGQQPGWVGQSYLGSALGLNQNAISFKQRIYMGGEEAWSFTRGLPFKGDPLVVSTDLNLDTGFFTPPEITLQMKSYQTTKSILASRNPPPKPMPFEGGLEYIDSPQKQDDSGPLLIIILLTAMVTLDPTAVSEPMHEYVQVRSYTY